MQNTQIISALRAFGLSGPEVKTYLQLLQLGTTTAASVARRIHENRSTTRYTLENLCHKHLAVHEKRKNTFYFTAEDPEKILLLLQDQEQEIKGQTKALSQVMGELKNLRNPHAKMPKVRFFEGTAGVKTAYEQLIDQVPIGAEMLSFAYAIDPGTDPHNFLHTVDAFVKKRVDKGITLRLLMDDSNLAKNLQQQDAQTLRQTKTHSQLKARHTYAGEIFIYDDLIYSFCVTPDALFAYTLTQTYLADMHRQLFEMAWHS